MAYIPRRKYARARLAYRKRGAYRKRKFLRKYKKGLGSSEKVYAFKRLGKDIQLLPLDAGTSKQMVPFVNGTSVPSGGSIKTGILVPEISVDTTSRVMYKQCGGSMLFRLTDIENSPDFTDLFDAYKISGVKVKIHWVSGVATAQQGWAERPTMLYAFDEDDADVPTAETQLRQRNDVKQHTFGSNKPLIMYIKPKAATALYSAGVSSAYTGYGPVTRQWVDCKSSSVEFYGLKFWLRNLCLPDANPEWGPEHFRVETTYYLKCRGVQ